jgi:hypothetical protein
MVEADVAYLKFLSAFAWTDWGKTMKISLRVAGNLAEIWSWYNQNTALELYRYMNLLNPTKYIS